MSSSPESATMNPDLFIYKNPTVNPDLEGGMVCDPSELMKQGDTFGRTVLDGSPFESVVQSEGLSLKDSPLGGLEQAEDVEEAGRFGGARRVGSFVTSKFVELKTGTQDAIGNFGETVSEKVKKHPKLIAGMAAVALLAGATQQAKGETTPANQSTSPAKTSGGGDRTTPDKIKRQIKGAMIRQRSEQYGDGIAAIRVDRAFIGQKGNYAAIVDVKPTRDLFIAAMYDHAGSGWIKFNTYVENGKANKDNYINQIGPAEKISYQPANNRIGDSVLTSIGKNPKWVGDALSNFATNNHSKTRYAKAGEKSIKAVTLNKKGMPTKIERYK